MLSQLWRNSQSKGLPQGVTGVLASQFHMDDESICKLRLYEKTGHYAGRQVRYVKLVDPALMTLNPQTKCKYDTLSQDSYKNAVQFEGRIEKDGTVYLTDRRAKPAASGAV